MNLADMLSYADIQSLSRIAEHYNCECNSNSKNELIQAILTAINRKEVVEQTLLNLSETDLKFLNTFLFEKRKQFTLEELTARVIQAHSSDLPAQQEKEKETYKPRKILSQYKDRGWLFNGFNTKTKYLFQFPEDLKQKFGDILQRQFERELHYMNEPAFYRDDHLLIVEDINTFLRYVHKEEVKLTADQVLYKRQLQQVLDLFNVKEAPPAKTAWRFGYGRHYKFYPDRFSFVYDYCYYSGCIIEDGELLRLTDRGRSLVNMEEKDALTDVYRFWLRLYKNPIYNLPAIVHWINRLAHSWVTIDSLKKVLCPYIKKFYYDTPDNILVNRILVMMLHLGLIRVGGDRLYEGTGIPEDAVVLTTVRGSQVIKGSYVHDEETIPLST